MAAYRVGKAGFEEVWPAKRFPALNGYPLALHPTEDRVWTGTRVFEFSTGRELATVNRGDLADATTPVWFGLNRVAEIAQSGGVKSTQGDAAEAPFQIALWDADSGNLVTSTPAQHAEWICASPDGLHLAEAGADKRVRIRDARTLRVEREFRAHESPLTGIIWHPTLPLLVTVAGDGMLRIWDANDFCKVEELVSEPYFEPHIKGKVYVQIPGDGRELNVSRMVRILVYQPESFRGRKPDSP